MRMDRRRLLTTGVAIALSGVTGPRAFSESDIGPLEPDIPTSSRWHPLTRSLLERARRINRGCEAPDRTLVELTIRQLADVSGRAGPLVIKWMDTPAKAFDQLSRLGLDALLEMGAATFWRQAQPSASRDVDAFERAFEVRMMANEMLGVEDQDRILMAPKLLAKSRAMSANRSDEEIFRVRATSSQIGWLETSIADVAASAVSNVELLLSTGSSANSVAIDNQLMVFKASELGLLATWETPDGLICVPVSERTRRT